MITTIDELLEFRDAELSKRDCDQKSIAVCMGSSCLAIGAKEIYDGLKNEVKKRDSKCKVKGVGCNGFCSKGPFVGVGCHILKSDDLLYQEVTAQDIEKIVDSVEKNEVLSELKCDTTAPFFAKQRKIVLENSGLIDPESIEDYIIKDGYLALFKALNEMSREDVIEEIKKSGLRGRGGGGYPTGLKWETVAKTDAAQKFIVCNGDEGDPGAFMDRSVMESDPHRVIEGMALAGYACNADMGYIYVRAEYPLAAERLQKAIKQAQKIGILGQKIAGTTFSFNLEIRLGGGAFVCGEATALITSIEGNRGNPRQKPPHLSDKGLWGYPTILNNVETFANVATIINRGGEWYSTIGTENCKGTKVFALSGQVKHTGLIEVDMGTTLQEIIFDIGGGVPDGKSLKAIQTGGPSGGCIP
ncbi:MAG: SLBB domain-containing protein, partial [Campylobacterales bacterium]|nr:SLBB domain-containing protein [Campylobacterales bacterium]